MIIVMLLCMVFAVQVWSLLLTKNIDAFIALTWGQFYLLIALLCWVVWNDNMVVRRRTHGEPLPTTRRAHLRLVTPDYQIHVAGSDVAPVYRTDIYNWELDEDEEES